MSADLLPALRDAVMAVPAATALLAQWNGEPAVFTRRPVPEDAPEPQVLINPPASSLDTMMLLSADTPMIVHDIAVYGRKGAAGTSEDQTRDVEQAARLLAAHFHRNRWSVVVGGYQTIQVTVAGPVPAPVDDERTVGRLIQVTTRLRRLT